MPHATPLPALPTTAPTTPMTAMGPWRTWANLVTIVRTVASIVVAIVAIVDGSLLLLAVAYGIYWVGDSLDGNVARWLDQETRLGAVFDLVSDRANSLLLIGGLLAQEPDFAVPLGIYIVQFMVIDTMLTLSFLCWPILSPNHFYRVDPLVHRLNWSIPAKTANTTLLIVLLLVAPVWVAAVVAVVQLAVKLWSVVRVIGLLTR